MDATIYGWPTRSMEPCSTVPTEPRYIPCIPLSIPTGGPTPHALLVPYRRGTKTGRTKASAALARENAEGAEAIIEVLEQGGPTDENCTYALDSGAHPSHIRNPTPNMRASRKKIPTQTATNSDSHGTHYGRVQIPTNRNVTLQLPQVANPSMKRNLLSVDDIAKKWGQVTFYPRRAAIYNMQHPYLPRCIGTATLQRGMYILDKPIKIFPVRAVAFATRTAPTPWRVRDTQQKTAEATWVENTRSRNSGPDRIFTNTSRTVMMPKREQKLHMNAMRNPPPLQRPHHQIAKKPITTTTSSLTTRNRVLCTKWP